MADSGEKSPRNSDGKASPPCGGDSGHFPSRLAPRRKISGISRASGPELHGKTNTAGDSFTRSPVVKRPLPQRLPVQPQKNPTHRHSETPRPLAPPQKPKPLVLPVHRRHACLAGPPANTCSRNCHQNKTQFPIVIPESPPQGGRAFPSESRGDSFTCSVAAGPKVLEFARPLSPLISPGLSAV